MPIQVARQPYTRATPPNDYSPAFLATELGKIQRAIPVASIRTITASDTASVLDQTVLGDATAGAVVLTLPTPASCAGLMLTVKKIDASANAVTVGATVDGVTNPTLTTRYAGMTVQSDGTAWHKLSSL